MAEIARYEFNYTDYLLDTVGSNDLTENGTITQVTDKDGNVDTAIQLSGTSSDYFSATMTNETAISVSTWVNLESEYKTGDIATKWSSGANGWRMTIDRNVVRFYINDNQVNYFIPSGFWQYWVNITGTYDGSDIKLYFDGQEVDTLSYATGITTNSDDLEIGKSFDGKINLVSIYDAALNSSAVENLNSDSTLPFPADVSLSEIGVSYVKVTFTGVETADTYEVYRSTDDISYSKTTETTGTGEPVTVTITDSGLTAGQQYYWKVLSKRTDTWLLSTGSWVDTSSYIDQSVWS